jgi:beta-hydroxylase
MDIAPVLRDPQLETLLRRDGFVTMPLISRGAAAELRDRYAELSGFARSGFASDLVVDDIEYRRKVDDTIAAALDEAAAAAFVGYEPFLRNFLCKYPGADSELYLHRDWMYIDERQGGRTYAVWVALEDIDTDNGQLRVLRRSHTMDRSLRGTSLTGSFLEHEDLIRPRLLSVPVRAGEAVIFDNALVHCSYPNHTAVPRVAAAVGLKPVGTPLIHFRRIDDRTAARYDIDAGFFLSETPQGLIARAPDLPIAETVELLPEDVDRDSMVAYLDQGLRARADLLRAQAHHAAATAQERSAAAAGRTAERVRLARERARERRSEARFSDRLRALPARASALREEAPSKLAMLVLGANEAVIDRFGPDTPAVWDPDQFTWSKEIERGYPKIRAEVEALLGGPTEIPHIEDVTGGIPQGNVGPWRSFVLMHQGRWIDWNCERCPETTRLVRQIPGLSMAGFSVLEPGTHITEHRGPNKGALRHQLGVIVPGEEGDCRIRVGDEMLHWREGESVMFDFTFPHEAWNDSDAIRVLLMLEVVTPLPWYLDRPNRLAQRAMGWFPTTRDIRNRLKALEPTLQRT